MGQGTVIGDLMSSALLVTSSFIIWKLLSFSASRSKQQQVLPTSRSTDFLLRCSSSTDLRCLDTQSFSDSEPSLWSDCQDLHQWPVLVLLALWSLRPVAPPTWFYFNTFSDQYPQLVIFSSSVIDPSTSRHYLLLGCSLQVLLLFPAAATVRAGTAGTPTSTQHPFVLPVKKIKIRQEKTIWKNLPVGPKVAR